MGSSYYLSKGYRNEQEMEPNEALGTFHGIAKPRRELKEQDLLRRLEECSNDNSDCTVDCTLKLGLSSDAMSQTSATDKNPRVDVYGAPQVMGKYGAYNRLGNVGSSHMNWSPTSRREEVGFYGSSSVVAPALSNTFNKDYARFPPFPMQQNNILFARMYQQRKMEAESAGCIRKCATCETTTTPLWRNGPKGAKTLCNACGIRFKKEERRAMGIADTHSRSKGAAAALKEPETSKKPMA